MPAPCPQGRLRGRNFQKKLVEKPFIHDNAPIYNKSSSRQIASLPARIAAAGDGGVKEAAGRGAVLG